MEGFQFLLLSKLVQELIVNEFVDNLNDRINFCFVCKEFNEIVQRVKPKKILFNLGIQWWNGNKIGFTVDVRFYLKSPDKFVEILKECQIRNLSLETFTAFEMFMKIDGFCDFEFEVALMEAAKYVMELVIRSGTIFLNNFNKFYSNLKNLKVLVLDSLFTFDYLPYF